MKSLKRKFLAHIIIYGIMLALTFVLAFTTILYDQNIYFKLAFNILLLIVLLLFVYEFIMWVAFEKGIKNPLIMEKIDIKNLIAEKNYKRDIQRKRMSKILRYYLFVALPIMAIGILVGIFAFESVVLSLVFPSVLLVGYFILFFINEILNEKLLDDDTIFELETVIVGKKMLWYQGKMYLIGGRLFKVRYDQIYYFSFWKIKTGRLLIEDKALDKRIREAIYEEVRN